MSLVNATHGLLAVYLLTLLAIPRAQTPLAAAVCLLCLLAGYRYRLAPLGQRLCQHWAMAVPLLAYASLYVLHILSGRAGARDWDQVLICLLSAGVLLSSLPARGPDPYRWLLPAAALGGVGALLVACWQYLWLDIPRPYGHLGAGPLGTGAIKFSDLSALLAVFALQLMLRGPLPRQRLLGGAGVAAGLGATILSQGRGALLGVAFAVTVYALLVWLKRRAMPAGESRKPAGGTGHVAAAPAEGTGIAGEAVRGPGAAGGAGTSCGGGGVSGGGPQKPVGETRKPASGRSPGHIRLLKWLVVMLCGAAVLAGGARFVGSRFAEIGPQMARFHAGDYDSEVSQRLALWSIALRAGRHAPLTGVGFAGFEAETQRQRDSGELPRHAIVYYAGPHNEYLAGLASAGVPGLLVIVLFFWAPLVVGCRRFLRNQCPDESLMLVLLSASYAVFTLTDSLLDRQITLLAYMLLASWLLSASGSGAPAASGPEQVSWAEGVSLPGSAPLSGGPSLPGGASLPVGGALRGARAARAGMVGS